MDYKKDTSPHILNTSSNLLGICFIVLTSLRVLNLNGKTIIDELTSVAMILFMISSVLSFLSMRNSKINADHFEKIADIIFLTGLFFLFAITMLITFDIIK